MRGKRNAGVLAAALFFCLSANSSGQSVLKDSFPDDWGAPSAPPLVPGGGTSSGNVPAASIHSGGFYSGGTTAGYELTLLGYEARVIEDWADPVDAFRLRISQEQSFTLIESGVVGIPMFLAGSITFAGPPFVVPPPSNFAYGEVNATASIYKADGTGAMLPLTRHFSGFAPVGPLVLPDYFTYAQSPAPLDAGTYRLRVTLEIAGEGGSISSLPGAEANVDFFDNSADHQRKGLAVSLGTFKDGLGNSRAAVKAPEARDFAGVDGTGVKVAVLEGGLAYQSHTALPSITLVEPGSPVPGDFRDEHTLAVAGIIGANTGDATATANNGIAPGASMFSASGDMYGGAYNALVALEKKGIHVVNMSANEEMETATLNRFINDHPNITFVKSAGNNGDDPGNTITKPGMAENIITVGGLNRDFTKRYEFSSTSDGETPIKPDIVAPAEYINIPVSRDINEDGLVNDFHRIFLGDDFDKQGGATVGEVSGTSFATPHVSGAAALLIQYQIDHDHHVQDHRAIKAVLLNAASTAVKHFDGGAWTQARGGAATPASPMTVTQSLDTELGAGMLDALESMRQFKPDEIDDSHTNAEAHFVIDATTAGPAKIEGRFWDLERVLEGDGTVDYRLGDIQGAHLRATLTWDAKVDKLQPLELLLYHEGGDELNLPGFDPAHPSADILVAATDNEGENVKLFDFALPPFGPSAHPGYYLQVINKGTLAVDYGLAVAVVPEPRMLGLLLLFAALRRRARHRNIIH